MSNRTDLPADPIVRQHIYEWLLGAAVLLIAVGTVAYSAFEGWSYVDSFYFSVVTTTTVGFGDITPETDGAKLFTAAYIIVGISIITTFLDARFKRHAQWRAERAQR